MSQSESAESPITADVDRPPRLRAWGAAAALAVLVAFGVLVGWMLTTSDGNPAAWPQRVAIFGTVAVLLSAAAGALFTSGVQRQQAAWAHQQVRESSEEAAEAKRSERIAWERAQQATTAVVAARALAGETMRRLEMPVDSEGKLTRDWNPEAAPDSALSNLRGLIHVIDKVCPPS